MYAIFFFTIYSLGLTFKRFIIAHIPLLYFQKILSIIFDGNIFSHISFWTDHEMLDSKKSWCKIELSEFGPWQIRDTTSVDGLQCFPSRDPVVQLVVVTAFCLPGAMKTPGIALTHHKYPPNILPYKFCAIDFPLILSPPTCQQSHLLLVLPCRTWKIED